MIREPSIPRVPKKIQAAIHMLIEGRARTKKEAAELAGISREHFARYLAKPHAAAFYDEAVRDALRQGKITATGMLIDLLEHASSEHVRLEAAKLVLALQGIKPPDDRTAVTIQMGAGQVVGYVIDLREPEPADKIVAAEESDPAAA